MSLEIKVEKQLYFPGEIIKGVCSLQLNGKCKDITICFKGKEHTRWSQGSGENRRTYQETFTMFKETQSLVTGDSSGSQSFSGNFQYPFEIQIPLCPATYDSKYRHGKIYYSITLKIHKMLLGTKKKIPIYIGPLTFITNELTLPNTMEHEKSICCLFCKGGMVQAQATTNKRGYLIDEIVDVKINLTNLSKRKVTKIEANFVQKTIYKAGSHTKIGITDLIYHKQDFTILKGQTESYNLQFPLAKDLTPSSFGRIINFGYVLRILIHVSGASCKSTFDLPVIVGSTFGEIPNFSAAKILSTFIIKPESTQSKLDENVNSIVTKA